MNLDRIDTENRLYVIREGRGFTCYGFDVLHKRAVRLAKWLAERPGQEGEHVRSCGVTWGALLEIEPIGTKDHFVLCNNVFERAQIHASVFGRCDAELTPALVALEGRRVEATVRGERKRFRVGRSTGWLPVHLMLHNRRSTGGDPIDAQDITNVRAVD